MKYGLDYMALIVFILCSTLYCNEASERDLKRDLKRLDLKIIEAKKPRRTCSEC